MAIPQHARKDVMVRRFLKGSEGGGAHQASERRRRARHGPRRRQRVPRTREAARKTWASCSTEEVLTPREALGVLSRPRRS
jgi:hypothetical protein